MTSAASTDPVRRRRYARAGAAHPMTALKMEVLRTVAASHYLSTPQVAGVMGISEKAARDHLRDLYDLELLDVLAVPQVVLAVGQFGMAAKVHFPTRTGLKALRDAEILSERALAAVRKPGGYVTLAHDLAVRDFLVWLSRSARRNAETYHRVETWECGNGLVLGDARPDAWLSYAYESAGKDRAVVGLLEVDRGTERSMDGGAGDRWAAKLAAYEAVFADEEREALFALTGFRRARLLVTVETQARAGWIIRRVQDSPLARSVWVALRKDLEGADALAPVWLRPDGSWQALVTA